jgi:hypothetical protein
MKNIMLVLLIVFLGSCCISHNILELSREKFAFECVNCKNKTKLIITKAEGKQNCLFSGSSYNGFLFIDNNSNIDTLYFQGFYEYGYVYINPMIRIFDNKRTRSCHIYDFSKQKKDSIVMLMVIQKGYVCENCYEFENDTLKFKKVPIDSPRNENQLNK